MAGPATLYQDGDHASRPANGAGCVLYACSTHGLIYLDDGSSWTTFADLAALAGSVDAADVSFTPAGTIAATDVQAAIEEVASEAGGGGIDSGTSFPGSPSTGDLFHRTDLQPPLWRYDGTRWLCTCLHEHHVGHVVNVSATTDIYTPNIHADMWLVNFITSMEAASGLSGSAYWRADLYTKDAGVLSSVLATTNIQSGTNANMIRGTAALNQLLAAGEDGFILEFAKVSTPGNLWGAGIVTYHLTAS